MVIAPLMRKLFDISTFTYAVMKPSSLTFPIGPGGPKKTH